MKQADSVTESRFKPRARLLLQLGDQLIRSENIAITELVKNSYDADASECKVTFKAIDTADGEIEIADDGIGMTPEVVTNVWLEPGADFKEAILDGNQAKFEFAVTLPKRAPIGEKGVGRFGVHKLGDSITLITKSPDSAKEVVIEINWKSFDQETYLENAKFLVTQREPQLFTDGKTGTRIIVKELRKVWDIDLYKELQRNLLSISSPFLETDFIVVPVLKLKDGIKQKKWESELITLNDIRDRAMWQLDCTLKGEKIVDFNFAFKPPVTMIGIEPRTITLEDLQTTQMAYKLGNNKESSINLDQYKIGPVRIQAYLFDLDIKVLKLSFQEPTIFKDYMAQNGGVRVYRDGMRVYDYGERDNDWLSLDKARINEPVDKIGNRNILAAVMLDRSKSKDLNEKTNREGFIESDAYVEFRRAINFAIDLFAQERNKDKLQIRKFYKTDPKTQPMPHDIDNLKDVIKDGLKDVEFDSKKDFTREIFSSLDRIKNQYVETNRILLKGAGAGLSLSVVIHEIDKRIKELSKLVEGKSLDTVRVRVVVQGVVKLVDNYSALVASDSQKNTSIKNIIEDAIFSSEFRFDAHKVTLVRAYTDVEDVRLACSKNTMIGVLINLFDNSIYWLHKYEVKDKKIYLDIRRYDDNEVGIIIADNGKGLGMDFEDAIQPFITNKPGGIGLGLHIVSEMMKTQKGRFISRGPNEVKGLPKEFKDGAIFELILKI
jgi:signal transduction histidine kinase